MLLDARAEPGEFAPGRDTEARYLHAGLRRRRGRVRAAHAVVELELTVGRHSGVPLETRGAIGRYDAARDVLELHGAAKVPHQNKEMLARMFDRAAIVGALFEVARRRRLRRARRDLSGGHSRLRRALRFGAPGEMDRGPPRASDRRQPVARAAPQGARRRRREGRAARASTTRSATTRAPICARTPCASPRRPAAFCRGPIASAPIARSATSGSPTRRRPRPIARRAATRRRSCASVCSTPSLRGSKLDPIEVRKRNPHACRRNAVQAAARGAGRGNSYDSGDYHELLDKSLDHVEVGRPQGATAEAPRAPASSSASGLATFVEKSGLGPADGVRMQVDTSGTVEVITGGASVGQGFETVMAQVAPRRSARTIARCALSTAARTASTSASARTPRARP